MTETQEVDRFKEFMDSYAPLKLFSDGSEKVNSKNLNERTAARNMALKYAAEHLGMKKALEDPTVKDNIPDSVIDKYFSSAVAQYGTEVGHKMEKSGRGIIADAPDKGLAKIVLGIEPCRIEGNDAHNRTSSSHVTYWNMNQVIEMYKKDSDDDVVLEKHKKALGVTLKYAQMELANSVQSNPALRDNEDIFKIMFEAVKSTLATSPNANITFAGDLRNKAKEEFETVTKTESAKADYARTTLAYRLEADKKYGKAYVAEQLGKAA